MEGRSFAMRGSSGDWRVVVGLEVHAQLASRAKLFSGAPTDFGAEPNTRAAPLDIGLPGQLPVINSHCVDLAIRAGLGMNAVVNPVSRFDRKNYFYPDLPLGYQISQYAQPIVGRGHIEVDDGEDGFTVGIERAHLEQDAGKSIHDIDPDFSHVDLNRAGIALLEIVTDPDMRSPEQAAECVRALRAILMTLEVCRGDMEKGHLRADVNVSVRRSDQESMGTRCEIKNVNSFRFIREAVASEARRQVDIIEGGGTIEQETRLFDPASGTTRAMRSKEDAHDYRYFPDPDLPPLRLTTSRIEAIRAALPELPAQKSRRLNEEYGLAAETARLLVADPGRSGFFEAVAKGRDARLTANWVTQDLLAALNREDVPISASPVGADRLGKLLDLLAGGTISGAGAKKVFALMWNEPGADPADLVARENLAQMSDTGTLETLVDEILAKHPQQVEQVRQQRADGHAKPKAFGWFVGQVMRASGGKANPPMVNAILKDRFGL